jgi:hypothetical protein
MAGLDNIKKYQVGGEVSTETPPSEGGNIPYKAPASTGMIGTIAMDPKETAKILANMQQYIDERENPLSQIATGLSRGMATAYGPESLSRFEAQKQAQDKQIMDYRQQMSALNAYGTQAQDFAKMKASNRVAGAPDTGAGVDISGSRGSLIPGVKMIKYAGVQMPQEYAMALENTISNDEYKTIWNNKVLPFVQKYAEISGNATLDSTLVPVQIKRNDGSYEATQVPVREYRAHPERYIVSPVGQKIIDEAGGDKPKTTAVDLSKLSKDPTLIKIAGAETGYRNVPNLEGASTAHGVYQITKPTFETVVSNNPDLKGITWEAFKANPEIQTIVAERKKAADAALMDKNKIEKTDLNHHTVWFSGDTKLATAPADTPIEKVMKPDQIAANKLAGKTAGEVRDMLQKRLDAGTQIASRLSGAPARTTTEEIPTYETSVAAQKGATKYSEFSGEQQAKDVASEYKDFKAKTEPVDIADRRQLATRNLQILGKKGNENIAGQLNDPGYMTGMLVLLRDGVQTPYGNVGMASMDDAMRRMAPNMSPETIKDSNELARNLGESGLVISSLMKGQGATSNFERDLYQRVVGSMRDNPELLKKLQVMMMARMDLNELMRTRHDALLKPGQPFDFGAFKSKDPEVKQAIQEYEAKLKAILGNDMTKLRTPEQARQIMSEAAQKVRSANPEAFEKAQKERRSSLVEKHIKAE